MKNASISQHPALHALESLTDAHHFSIVSHISVPAGATAKNGPGAGVAIFTALASLLSGRKVKSDVDEVLKTSLESLQAGEGG